MRPEELTKLMSHLNEDSGNKYTSYLSFLRNPILNSKHQKLGTIEGLLNDRVVYRMISDQVTINDKTKMKQYSTIEPDFVTELYTFADSLSSQNSTVGKLLGLELMSLLGIMMLNNLSRTINSTIVLNSIEHDSLDNSQAIKRESFFLSSVWDYNLTLNRFKVRSDGTNTKDPELEVPIKLNLFDLESRVYKIELPITKRNTTGACLFLNPYFTKDLAKKPTITGAKYIIGNPRKQLIPSKTLKSLEEYYEKNPIKSIA